VAANAALLLYLYNKRPIMKNVILVLAIVCLPAFHSFSQTAEQKFIGTWKALRKKTTSTLAIAKTGQMFKLTNTSGQGSEQKKTMLTYIYKDGSLTSAGAPDFGAVIFVGPSGHLMWNGDEWEKISGKPE
jgi:hypothetical protein